MHSVILALDGTIQRYRVSGNWRWANQASCRLDLFNADDSPMRTPVSFCTSASVVALLSTVVVRAISSFNATRRAVASVETARKLSVVF